MRHNQNGRRYRGRGNSGGQSNNHHHNNHGGQRRINPRVHTFDSNGPDVRIRGNAYQITEKYQTLAKDAAAAGDRVLAESYLQHAEHYQRLINELSDDYNRQQQSQQQGGQHAQPQHNANQPSVDPDGEQPTVDADLNDLDQGFLVGRRGATGAAQAPAEESVTDDDVQPAVPAKPAGRASRAAAAKAAE